MSAPPTRDDLQVHLTLTINFASDQNEDIQGKITYQFGVNHVPTKAEIDEAIKTQLAGVNEQFGLTDARLTKMEDWGYATTRGLDWKFGEPVAEADGK